MNRRTALKLRLACVHEARALAGMSRELIETGLRWRYTPPRIEALIRDPDTVVLVACDAWHIHGFAVMQFGDEQAHLTLLCVQPDRQRRGIARQLNDWLVASARVAGIRSIVLELRADNDTALAFYRRVGFEETETVPGYYGGRLDAKRMVLTLRTEPAV